MRRPHPRAARFALCALTAALLAAGSAQAQQSSIFDDLLLKLKDKGVLTEDEYESLKAARDEERSEQRAERRQQALKQAQAAEKEEKAKEEAKTGLLGKFNNGFTWETADKKNSITVSGRVQLDYRAFSPEGATGTPAQSGTTTTNGFDVRRAYLGLQGRVWEYYTFDVTGNFASTSGSNLSGSQSNSHLDVAWINAEWFKPAQIRLGQFKMPYSVEELTSSRFIDYTERSLLNQLVPAKEVGAMVWGAPWKGTFYGLALSNGQGQGGDEVSSQVDGADFIGRVGANFAEILGHKNSIYHLAFDYTDGDLPTSSNGASGNLLNVRTEGRGMTFFQVANSSFTGAKLNRQRTGLEGAVALGPVKLQAEWMGADFSGTSAAGVGYDRGVDVYYVSANWWITGESWASAYRNGTFGRVVPKNNLRWGEPGLGALMVGLRYSHLDASDFTTTNPAGTGRLANGFTNAADAYTLGLTWVVAPNLRFYLDYVKTEFDTPVTITPTGGAATTTDNEKAINFRAGIDF
jgi:phosphate-selective porin OprO/OprP